MSIKYLLPCSCGNQIPVETTQAGQSVTCSCGRAVPIPSMQGIRKLQSIDDSPQLPVRSTTGSGIGVGLGILGLVILVVGGVLMYRTHARKPVFIGMEYMTPWDTWVMWQDLKEGVRLPEYADTPYMVAKRTYRQYMAISTAILVVGALLVTSGAVVLSLSGRRSSRGAP